MKKKVLIYSDCFTYSGSENVIENILRSKLLHEEYNIKFYYAYNNEYDFKLRNRFKNDIIEKYIAPIYIFSEVNFRNDWGKKKGLIKYFYLMLFLFAYILRIIGFFSILNYFKFRKLFNSEKPDILFINNGGYPGALTCRIAAVVGQCCSIPKIVFMVNNMAFPARNCLDKWLDKKVNNAVNFFITASLAASHQLVKVRQFPKDKVHNIPNTIYSEEELLSLSKNLLRDELSISDNTFVFGSAGLLTKRKGFHVFIEAIHILVSRFNVQNVIFVIAGEGEERNKLETLIKGYNLQNIVFLLGYRTDVLRLMAGFDVFVLPSTNNEDFPYVIIEAMILSKPIIGTYVAGIPEQISDGETGYLVNPNDAKSLAQKMNNFIQNKQSMVEMGNRGREKYFAQFGYTKIMEAYLNIFKK